jgi:hypothetical protein
MKWLRYVILAAVLIFSAALVIHTPTETVEAQSGCPDFSQSARLGSTSLDAGFLPDPYRNTVTSGGSTNARNCSRLPSSCVGYVTNAPDFSVRWDGRGGMLRFYYIGEGDPTLIVNDSSGRWHCNDDSNGGLNPTITLNSAGDGRYDIWVGNYAGDYDDGTLYITERSSCHAGNSCASSSFTPPRNNDNSYAVVCLENETNIDINYSFRWGTGQWQTRTVDAGRSRWHSWEYDSDSRSSPNFEIEFDADTRSGSTRYLNYDLERYQNETESCSGARLYVFQRDGSRWIDLYSRD